MASAAIARSGVPEIKPANLDDAIARRLDIYRRGGQLPVALVNVGGNQVIFGSQGHKAPLKQALTLGYHPEYAVPDGLAAPFIHANRPVIHFINIAGLAAAYGVKPDNPPGTSRVMYDRSIPALVRLLAVAWLGAAAFVLWFGGRKEWWRGPCR